MCSLRYPASSAHAPYCHPCPARLYSIFSHYLINGTILGKKLLDKKYFFLFSVQGWPETFLIQRRNERDTIKKNMYWSSMRTDGETDRKKLIVRVGVLRIRFKRFSCDFILTDSYV